MGDFISREAAIKALSHGDGCGHVCRHSIERIPAADVVEVKHGWWLKDRRAALNGGDYEVFVCSECESAFNWRMRYCGHCGAKMDGGQKYV